MKYLTLVAAVCLYSGAASAADIWLCEDGTGHRYQSSQNVPSDSCKKLESDEATLEPASIKLPERSNPKWGVEAFCKSQKAGTCEVSKNALELGELNGAWFRLIADSAVVAGGANGHMSEYGLDPVNWRVNCSRDKMSSIRSCVIHKGDLYIFVKPGGKILVSVGYDHFPSSQSSIKIGAKRFDTSERDGNFAHGAQLINLMHNDVPIVTRYMKWPYRTWVDDEFRAYGIGTAVQVAKWIIAKGEM